MRKERDTNAWVSEDRTAVWIGLAVSAIGFVILWITY